MKKRILYIHTILLVLFFVSCTNELNEFLESSLNAEINDSNGNLNNNSNLEEQQIEKTKQNNPQKNTDNKIENIIILTKKDADISAILEDIGATQIKTVMIENEMYTKIRGDIKRARAHKEIISAEKEVYRSNFVTPNDTLYSVQYSPVITELEDVWDSGYTGVGVKVAVIDSGVNTLHEDFGGSSTFEAGYDASTRGVYSTTTNNDDDGHGTHVAGIIGARKNNGKGISGVAPDVTIIPFRADSGNGAYTSTDIADAIIRASDAGANVINMSLGGLGMTGLEAAAVRYAISKNVNIVVASGNDFISIKSYPASYPGVIVVGASNGRDEVASFSTRSSLLTVVAPGEDIISLEAGNSTNTTGYVSMDGTSMAAPFVSGVVALIIQKFPTATPTQVVDTVLSLYDSEGNLIASNDDKSDSSVYSEIVFIPNSGDVFTVKVEPYWGDEGYYRIMLQKKLSNPAPTSAEALSCSSDVTGDTDDGISSANLVDIGNSYENSTCGRFAEDDIDTFTITIP